MQLPKANDDLFPIVTEHICSWNESMQTECALSFLKPIQLNLFNDRSTFKIIQKSIAIIEELLSLPEHKEIVGPWVNLLGIVCTKVQMSEQKRELIPFLQDLLNNKSPIESRKVGNRILFSIAANIGEEGLDKEYAYIKMMRAVFNENNFKLRIDGIVFLKNYFNNYQNISQLIETDRFQDLYLPELLGYLEDGDQQLVCDAILCAMPLLDYLEEEVIVKMFLP